MPQPKITLTYTHEDIAALVKADAKAKGLTVIDALVRIDTGQYGRGPDRVTIVANCGHADVQG